MGVVCRFRADTNEPIRSTKPQRCPLSIPHPYPSGVAAADEEKSSRLIPTEHSTWIQVVQSTGHPSIPSHPHPISSPPSHPPQRRQGAEPSETSLDPENERYVR